jgi:Helix-turn-helix domain
MNQGMTASRRQALGLMSFGVAATAAGVPVVQIQTIETNRRVLPSREELERALRLYGGEFGGGGKGG